MPERVIVTLAGEADIDSFRREARRCVAGAIAPQQIDWQVATRVVPDLFCGAPANDSAAAPMERADQISVPGFFMPLFERAALHADANRFGLIYRLLWRLVHEPTLRHDPLDADRQAVETMARAVRRDMHKMTAFVRFRPLAQDDGTVLHVAWFEPEHHIVEATAPFFARRFAQMHWAILSPECCARWDGQTLSFGPGADPSDAPAADASESLWLTYYASIFNPARLKLTMMQKEMPRRYWKNLPEAVLIQPLAASAAQRRTAMIEQPASPPNKRRPASSNALTLVEHATLQHAPRSLTELHAATQRCRDCPIGAQGTQAVNGEGPLAARLMLVGEQPGDREDLSGRPFVGPAGQLLDRALAELGWPRDRLYLTNAVRHFKYELRGKRRIHKSPAQQEVAACLHWLESEIAMVKPLALVALGATAARALLGRPVAVMKERGLWFTRDDGLRVLVTLHPSALLRMEPSEQQAAFAAWIADLKQHDGA